MSQYILLFLALMEVLFFGYTNLCLLVKVYLHGCSEAPLTSNRQPCIDKSRGLQLGYPSLFLGAN